MEKFDLVDENDNVIGTTDKPTAHANRQPHRAVAIYVFDKNNNLFVQIHKKSGGLYDHSVGGHVSQGEDYQTAALREASEELNLTQPLNFLLKFYSEEGKYLHMFGVFECTVADDWHFIPNFEVEEIVPMELDKIWKMMESNPEKFTGGFINTMKEYRKIKKI